MQIGTKEKKQNKPPFYPILTFPQFWMVIVWSSNVLASTFQFLHPLCLGEKEKPLPESLCIASLYSVRALSIACFLKNRREAEQEIENKSRNL